MSNFNSLLMPWNYNRITHHLFAESSDASSLFPATRVVTFPVLPPLDFMGGIKLPRTPRRENPYDLAPYPLFVLSLCGETDVLGDPAKPRFCFASISYTRAETVITIVPHVMIRKENDAKLLKHWTEYTSSTRSFFTSTPNSNWHLSSL